MRHDYTPPREEIHAVRWDLHAHPGLFTAPGRTYSARDLVPELVQWLDANAPGWVLTSDWDGFTSASDDLEGRLRVADAVQANGFIAEAMRISRAWHEADHLCMAHRLEVVSPDGARTEIARGHHPINALNHQRELERHVVLDRQPWRAEFFRAMRAVEATIIGTDGPIEASPEVREGTYIVPGVRIVVSRVAVPG